MGNSPGTGPPRAGRHPPVRQAGPAALNVTLLGRYYERFADHAVEIGRRVVFLVTGVLPPEDAEAEKI